MKKTALITGITGQDGSFLAEFLLEKGYDVHGTIRRSSVDYRERIVHLEGHPDFHLHYADLGDSMSILQVVKKVKPDEIYNLAAQSHVQVSFDSPEFTADVDATGVLRILEAVRQCDLTDTCRIYQASTSELYGKVEEVPQNENTPFHPYSPYAVQTVRLLDRKGVPRGIRDVLLFGHPVQSRERTAGRDVRHPEDHACRRPYCSRKARQTLHGQPVFPA